MPQPLFPALGISTLGHAIVIGLAVLAVMLLDGCTYPTYVCMPMDAHRIILCSPSDPSPAPPPIQGPPQIKRPL